MNRLNPLSLLVFLACALSACGGSFTVPEWMPPAFDSVNVCTDGEADLDVTLGDLPLYRLKTDGAACAGYDLRTGPVLEAEACAVMYAGPMQSEILSTCVDNEGSGEGAE